MIDEKKLLAIELFVDGELNKTEIAEKCNVARSTLYNWLEDEEFVVRLDERIQEKKKFIQKKIDSKLDFVIEKLYELANDNTNKRVQASVLQYLCDRSLGKNTARLEIEAGMNYNANTSDDVLEQEFDLIDANDDIESV